MNSSKKYEEKFEQEFFWNEEKPRTEKQQPKLNRETALNVCNNLLYAVSHDQKLLEQVKQLKQYIRERV